MFCVGTCCRLEMKVLTARRAQMKWMVPIFIKQQASILFQWKQSSYQLILYSQQFNPFFFNLFFWVETLRPVTHSKSNTNWSNCQKYFMSWFPPTSYLFPWLKVFCAAIGLENSYLICLQFTVYIIWLTLTQSASRN